MIIKKVNIYEFKLGKLIIRAKGRSLSEALKKAFNKLPEATFFEFLKQRTFTHYRIINLMVNSRRYYYIRNRRINSCWIKL